MSKKNSIVQKKNHYRNLEKTFGFLKYPTVIAPFITIGIVNYDKYFVEYNGTKMSIAFIMALAVMGIAIWSITKKKLENSFATLLIGWATLAFIFQLMGQMILDLSTIMWFGLIGLGGAYGLDEASKSMAKKKERVIKAMENAEDEKDKEQYAQEIKDE